MRTQRETDLELDRAHYKRMTELEAKLKEKDDA